MQPLGLTHANLALPEKTLQQCIVELDIYAKKLDELSSGTEGFGNVVHGILNSGLNIFSATMSSIKNIFARTFSGKKRSDLETYIDHYKATVSIINGKSYSEIMNIKVPYPSGMKVNYITAVDEISLAYKDIDISSLLLTTVTTFINMSHMLDGDKADLTAASAYLKEGLNPFIKKTTLVKNIDNKMLVLISPNASNVGTTMQFSKCYKSMKEFTEVTDKLIKFGTAIYKTEAINDQVDQLTMLANGIIVKIDALDKTKHDIRAFAKDMNIFIRHVAVTVECFSNIVKNGLMLENNHIKVLRKLSEILGV
jgi:hypothetical protein